MLLTRSCFLGPSEPSLQSRSCDGCRTLKIHTKPWPLSVTGGAELTATLAIIGQARKHCKYEPVWPSGKALGL